MASLEEAVDADNAEPVLVEDKKSSSPVAVMDDEDDEIAVVGVIKATVVVVDLCSNNNNNETAGNDDTTPASQYKADLVKTMRKNKRKRSCVATSQEQDAIEIDVNNSNDTANTSSSTKAEGEDVVYRQALGPVRMDFVHSWKSRRHRRDGGASSSSGQSHAFADRPQPTIPNVQKIYKELLEYKLNLPIDVSSSIFVRVQESRLDLLRVLITGPEGTPYANGCFLFDVQLTNYPAQAPAVKFLTTGSGKVRFNPNLYNCGKVCLSLLGTWSGPGWQPNKSTLLQVLVSIQGLILVPDPYFNEPGYERDRGTRKGDKSSATYNANIRRFALQYAMDDFLQKCVNENHDYPEFGDVILRHFACKAAAMARQLDEWTAQDASLTAIANRMRTNLAVVVDKYKQEVLSTKPAARPVAAAASATSYSEPIVLE